MHAIINNFRKKTLGLSTLTVGQATRLILDEPVPFTYCWSPSLVPKPRDWSTHIHISGFFFLDLATNYQPPETLVEFLDNGDPPIYIGFGSITGHDSDRLLKSILEALRKTNYRALLLGFKVNQEQLPENVFKIDNCPHDWLFQRGTICLNFFSEYFQCRLNSNMFLVSSVCHHGGAGTTAAGLRAGKPTIVVPFFGDQFFWGSMISKSGAGPNPIPGKIITTDQFVDAFNYVHTSTAKEAALMIQKKFQGENGCETAARAFHAHLPLNKMRSDLDTSFTACFQHQRLDLHLSLPVAQILVSSGKMRESDLLPLTTYGWNSLKHGKKFKAFSRASSNQGFSVLRSLVSGTDKNLANRNSQKDSDSSNSQKVCFESHFARLLPYYGEPERIPINLPEESAQREEPLVKNLKGGLSLVAAMPILRSARPKVIAIPSGTVVTGLRVPETIDEAPHVKKIPTKGLATRQSRTLNRSTSLFRESAKILLPEQIAANVSGYTIDACRKIISKVEDLENIDRRSTKGGSSRLGSMLRGKRPSKVGVS